MRFHRLYARILARLREERRLAVALALGNIALAVAQFAEPLLLGRIVDRLSRAQSLAVAPKWADLALLLAAWVGFGLFTILAGVLVALHADRLAHRRRLAVMSAYFDHVLHLPAGFHDDVHSGRLLKIMLEGSSDGGLWLSFFRENCASFVAIFVLLPLSLIINARLAALLIGLVALFAVLTIFVLRRTEGMQARVEVSIPTSPNAPPMLGNVPVIQSFARAEAESRALARDHRRAARAQMPVLSWWALAAVATRASATLTLLSIFLLGAALYLHGLATIGEIVMFMNFAIMLIAGSIRW